jgi:hypothetical protein
MVMTLCSTRWVAMLAATLCAVGCPRSSPEPEPAASGSTAAASSSAGATVKPERTLGARVEVLSLELERMGAASAVDPKRGLLYVWGGALAPLRPGGRPLRADPGLLDVIDLRAGTSSQLRLVGNGPTGVHVPAMAFDPRGAGSLYLFGGWPEAWRRPVDTLHRIDLGASQPSVQPVPKKGSWPSARNGAAMVCDTVGNSLLLYGGDSASGPKNSFQPEGDFWRFDLETQQWEQITTGRPPSARWHAAMVMDEPRRQAYLFGGAGQGSTAFDARLYQLDVASSEWRALPSGGDSPPSLQGTTLTFDVAARALVLAGGLRSESPGAAVPSELWLFDLQSDRWRKLDGGGKLTRRDHVAGYDPETGAHLLLGGHVSQKVGNYYEIGDFVLPSAKVVVKAD